MTSDLRSRPTDTPSSAEDVPERPQRRQPWEPPRILYREPLEAMAAVCAPSPPAKGNPGFCPSGPISS